MKKMYPLNAKPSTVEGRGRKKRRILLLILTTLLSVLWLSGCSTGDAFRGTWDLDGTTKYEFDGTGSGAMVLPDSSYVFRYAVDEEAGTISIDFADDKVNDYTYAYTLQDKTLTLSGGNGKESFMYEFTKIK